MGASCVEGEEARVTGAEMGVRRADGVGEVGRPDHRALVRG